MNTVQVKFAESAADIERCFPVMVQLRAHIDSVTTFVERVQRQQRQDGYQLAYLEDEGQVKAVAGCRIMEMLSRSRFMYVDDLVTDESERSKGYGGLLFDWLVEYARSQGCRQFDLDSGVQRTGAHRFYFRKRMRLNTFHFVLPLDEETAG